MKFIGPFLVVLLQLFNRLCAALSSQQALYRVGSWLGGVNFFLQRKRKAIALSNLELILGDDFDAKQRKSIARASFDAMSAIYFELFWQPERHGIKFDDWARCEGFEHLEAAHAQGKGVIVASPHIGNWTVLARAVIARGYKFGGLMRPSAIPAVRNHFARELGKVGINPTNTPLPPGGFKTMTDGLAQGNVLMLVADRRSNDYLIDFMGKPAWTAHGVATTHLRSGAPIVTAYAVREKDHHRLVFQPAIVHQPTDDKQADTIAILTEVNNRFSKVIRQHPEQWLWLHERWRGRRRDQQSTDANQQSDKAAASTDKSLDAVNE